MVKNPPAIAGEARDTGSIPGSRGPPGEEIENQCGSLVISIATERIWLNSYGSAGKESACNARYLGSIPGLGRSPGGGHGNPLQYFCLRIPMDRGAWLAIVHGVAKSQTRLND